MKNLYEETEEFLSLNGLSFDDVRYISGRDKDGNEYEIDTKDFMKVSSKYNYDDGYGLIEVPLGLTICGEDWWLERFEYDGSERWVMKSKPKQPNTVKTLTDFSRKDSFEPYCVFA